MQWQQPDEWRLDAQLLEWASALPLAWEVVDSEHFLTRRDDLATLMRGRKQWLMEHFYRHMRRRWEVLLDAGGAPEGGQWNFDHDNRKCWPGTPPEPADWRPRHDHSALWDMIQRAGVGSFGDPQASAVRWPLNRSEALACLDAFITTALPHFGDYEDATMLHIGTSSNGMPRRSVTIPAWASCTVNCKKCPRRNGKPCARRPGICASGWKRCNRLAREETPCNRYPMVIAP